jgi:ABC-type molybdate transport system ATPase subunit
VLDLPFLTFEEGRLYAITGHKGSGKTTLLRIAAALEKPTQGHCHRAQSIVRIGFCAQKPYMFRGSVRQNIVWGLPCDPGRAPDEVAERLGIGTLLDQPARMLSAGEAQKVSFARMLLRDPQILFLDEPTANLDESGRAAFEREIAFFVKQGATCVMATHMADHAFRLNGTIVRLERGKITHGEVLNIFEGALEPDAAGSLIRLTEKVGVRCAVPAGNGRRRFCIPAADVVLSRQPLESSMQNSFPGVITSLRRNEQSIEATIDIGISIRALLTPSSLARLSLTLGTPVVASFKATAVRTL